jgi:hypothetical protein
MIRPAPQPSPRRRSGLVLLEVIIALAVFVAAAAMTLQITSSLLDSLHRARTTQMAEDIALSLMAELEAGLITLRDVRTGATATVRGLTAIEDEPGEHDPVFELEVIARRSEYAGLSYVELSVTEIAAGGGMIAMPATDDAPPRPSATVRRLVPVTDEDVEAYEQDEMLEDIDTGSPLNQPPAGAGGF